MLVCTYCYFSVQFFYVDNIFCQNFHNINTTVAWLGTGFLSHISWLSLPSHSTVVLFWQWVFSVKFWSQSQVQVSSVQLLSPVRLFTTPWIIARQASLSITNSRSLPRLTSIESVMPFSHLILCHPLLLLPPIPPSIRVFSNESTLRMRWPKYWGSGDFYCLDI